MVHLALGATSTRQESDVLEQRSASTLLPQHAPKLGDVEFAQQPGYRRFLLQGATGQVGTVLGDLLQAEGMTVLRTSRTGRGLDAPLDLAALPDGAKLAAVLDPLEPEAVVCAGAMTWVDGCERDPDAAWAANVTGPAHLASYAFSRQLPFVSFSSDYVFAGQDQCPGPYKESDTPGPLNVYGVTKLQGEQAILQAHPGALILRTSWVYGPDREGRNFMSSLLRQLHAGQRVPVPSDQVSTPTLNRDLALAALALLQVGASGVVHACGPELISRYELAMRIAVYFGLPKELVEAVPTDRLGQAAARPLRSGLRSERLWSLLPTFRFRTLEEGFSRTAEFLNKEIQPAGSCR